jgi:DNA-binding beta-propeller fold protein YncE
VHSNAQFHQSSVGSKKDDMRPYRVQQKLFFQLGVLLLGSFVARADYVYVAEDIQNTITRIDPGGNQFIIADASSGVYAPQALAFDSHGNLFVANGDRRILKIDANGQTSLFTTYAGPGAGIIRGLAFDAADNLYASDSYYHKIEKFDLNGNGTVFASDDHYQNIFYQPYGVAFDHNGNLYAANFLGSFVTKIDPAGNASRFSRTGAYFPQGLAFYGNNVYIANLGDNAIVKFDANGNPSTFAVNGVSGAVSLAFDSLGNLYCANVVGTAIEVFDPQGNASLFAPLISRPTAVATGPLIVPEPSACAIMVLAMLGLARAVSRR